MNWFGLFTCASVALLILGRIVYELGYDKAVEDISVSRNWCLKKEREHVDSHIHWSQAE